MYLVLMFSILLSGVSEVWFLVWCGLEFSVLSFLLYMASLGMTSRAMMLYFVSQIFGSFLLVTSTIITAYSAVSVLMVAAVMYKMGFAPGNIWAGVFVGGMGLSCGVWFFVLLKLAPLAFMGGVLPLIVFPLVSMLLGITSIGSSMLLTNFLYWSGLVGVVWLFFNKSTDMMWLYYIVYSIIMLSVLLFPLSSDISVFSFAGLPPFSLFFAKVLVLGCAVVGLGVVLVGSALASIVYYSRWLISSQPDAPSTSSQAAGYMYVLLSK